MFSSLAIVQAVVDERSRITPDRGSNAAAVSYKQYVLGNCGCYLDQRIKMIKLACCGDDCNYCLRYIGTINNNTEKLIQAAGIWFKAGLRDRLLSPDEMKCNGCVSVPLCRYGIKDCCEKKEIDNCGYCNEYPCDKIEKAFTTTKEYDEKSKKDIIK